MSGPMSDLLHCSLGDSRYSDNVSNRYQHGQYGLLSGNYMNECNLAFDTHPDRSLPTSPLHSPFDPHREAASLDLTAHSHDISGSTTMRTQVSAYNAYTYCWHTLSTSPYFTMQQMMIWSLHKTRCICAFSRTTWSLQVIQKRWSTFIASRQHTDIIICSCRKAYQTIVSAPGAVPSQVLGQSETQCSRTPTCIRISTSGWRSCTWKKGQDMQNLQDRTRLWDAKDVSITVLMKTCHFGTLSIWMAWS